AIAHDSESELGDVGPDIEPPKILRHPAPLLNVVEDLAQFCFIRGLVSAFRLARFALGSNVRLGVLNWHPIALDVQVGLAKLFELRMLRMQSPQVGIDGVSLSNSSQDIG